MMDERTKKLTASGSAVGADGKQPNCNSTNEKEG